MCFKIVLFITITAVLVAYLSKKVIYVYRLWKYSKYATTEATEEFLYNNPKIFGEIMKLIKKQGNKVSNKPILSGKTIKLKTVNNGMLFRLHLNNYLSNVGGRIIGVDKDVVFENLYNDRGENAKGWVYTIEVPANAKYSSLLQHILDERFDYILFYTSFFANSKSII